MPTTQTSSALQSAQAFVTDFHREHQGMSLETLQSVEDVLVSVLPLLRRSKNFFCSINQLAPEILIHIFWHTMDAVKYASDMFVWPSATLKSTQGFIKLAHVCHRWREICLGAHSLWGQIIYDCELGISYRTPLMNLSLCGEAPLKVYLYGDTADEHVRALLRKDGSRIKELHIHSTVSAWPDFTAFAASSLEHLTIHVRTPQLVTQGGLLVPTHMPATSSRSEQPKIFHDHLPHLKVLSLHSASSLPSNHFADLTHLCLRAPSLRRGITAHLQGLPDVAWTLLDLCAFLADCPRLEEVILAEIKAKIRDEDHTLPTVALNRLRRLAMGNMSSALLVWLASHLEMPTDVGLRIFGPARHSSIFLAEILPHVKLPHDPHILVLRDSESYFADPILTASVANATSGIQIQCVLYRDDDGWSSSVWSLFPLSNVRELHIYPHNYMQSFADISSLLQMLPSLSTLVYGFAAKYEDLLDTILSSLSPTSDASAVLCPSLTTLHVFIGASLRMLDAIVEFAMSRAEAGYPLSKVIIEHYPDALVRSDDEELRKYVETVELRISEGEPPKVVWPAVCTSATHKYWPRW